MLFELFMGSNELTHDPVVSPCAATVRRESAVARFRCVNRNQGRKLATPADVDDVDAV